MIRIKKSSILNYLSAIVIFSCSNESEITNLRSTHEDSTSESDAIVKEKNLDEKGTAKLDAATNSSEGKVSNENGDDSQQDNTSTIKVTMSENSILLNQNSTGMLEMKIESASESEVLITSNEDILAGVIPDIIVNNVESSENRFKLQRGINIVKINFKHLVESSSMLRGVKPMDYHKSKILITYGDKTVEQDVRIALSNVFIVKAKDPDENGGRMVSAERIILPIGVGLAILNEYKPDLRLHGNPHQQIGGMALGEAYDKYGGKSIKTIDSNNVTPCATPGSDLMYDHDSRSLSGEIVVVCEE
ncbi:MAG: hypothetical protein R3B45_07790 [Bdellovibrionota bacterium]